jgi:uncharacterized membrane protein
MGEPSSGKIEFLKTTAIGGLVFLLPLVVVGAALGYVYHVVMLVYQPLHELLGVSTFWGVAVVLLLAIGLLVALCFVCGLTAQRAMARQFTQTLEKQLVMLVPKYAIYKDILAGNIGGDTLAPTLKPVTVRLDDMIRIGFESGRPSPELVTVYLPGAPDPWIGSVALVEASRVQPLEVSFSETGALCERLGRDSDQLLAAVRPAGPAK